MADNELPDNARAGSVTSAELIEAVGGVPEGLEVPAWVQDWTRDSAQHARS